MPIHSTKAQLPPAPQNFARKKTVILEQLAVPDDSYTDLSPKGSVDVGIRDLIDEINAIDGLVTTSSCAGRVSVFLEGHKSAYYSSSAVTSPLSVSDATDHQLIGSIDGTWEAAVAVSSLGAAAGGTVAGTGGKGGGGKWLFVSHDQVETQGKLDSEPNIVAALFGLEEPIFDGHLGAAVEDLGDGESRLIHFKFEPMILHVLTASPEHAQVILRCAVQAGFRESGAVNLLGSSQEPATPIVAVRSMGMGFGSLIGREINGTKHCNVSGEYLRALIAIANERFIENTKRIDRFRRAFKEAIVQNNGGGEWEDAVARRERKKEEGLKRAAELAELRKLKEEQPKQEVSLEQIQQP